MIPVLFLSGSGTSADKVRGLDLGAVDYITKPFDDFELRARVRAAIRTKHLQDLLDRACAHRSTDRPSQSPRLDGSTPDGVGPDATAWRASCRSSWPISTVSSGSTTRTATASATKCSRKWPGPSPGNAEKATCRRGMGARSLRSWFPNAAVSGAIRLAERCRREIEKVNLPAKGEPLRPTASFGVADAVEVSSAELLVDHADQALYRAKAAGRNRVAVWPRMSHLCQPSNRQ